MKATAEKLEKNEVLLEIEVDDERFSKALNRAYKKIAKQVNIPGFRKGKAPKVMIDRYVGQEAVYHEVVEDVFPSVYQEAIEKTEISPIGQPEVEKIQAEEGKPLVFKLKVPVKPEVNLGQYKGFDIEKPAVEVTDEDVQQELERMQNRHAKLVSVEEGELADGDTAMIDFTGYVDGEAFEGGHAENYPLVVGSSSFIPGFEEQLVGMKINEEKDVTVTFPEEYHADNLAGKEAVFKVKLVGIKRKELNPLDDEFAKDVSEFDTLEELKTDILNKLREERERQANAKVNREALEKAVEEAEVEIPDVMIENRLDEMVSNMENRLRTQGIQLEQYLQYTNSNIDDLRDKMREDAHTTVLQELVLDAIAKAEGITATDDEVETEIAMMAPQFNKEPAELKLTLEALGDLKMVKEDITRRKTMKFLMEQANVIEKAAE
ncbi:trigger factor [Desulfofalx alkaliphila]|uniref:trigger factor n=1 Tax=Desulfofalx alkaliphila TaxID=105483 RepID=UPI0004E27E77|nr:trigger factor [Desulfofalx alkaliphila]